MTLFRLLNLFLFTFPFGSAFDRDSCFATAKNLLSNQSLSPNSPFFFRDTFRSPPYNGPENMTLTLEGCNVLCGPKQTWYTDIGPRLTIWLVPILLLLANVELSPIDKRRFLAILHLLGDPTDSIWSLLHKLDAWDHCCTLAEHFQNLCPSCQGVVAAVFAGFEEVQGPRITSERDYEVLLQQYSQATHFNEWRRAAVRLADGQTNELGRTMLAFLLYVLQLVAAFVPEVGGAPPGPPGGHIATSVLLSWFVPVILLSNAIGNLPSRRTAYDILTDLSANTGEDTLYVPHQRSVFLPTFPSVARSCTTDYFYALGWSGAIYTYRPWKLRYIPSRPHHHLYTLLLCTLAAMPVLIGFIGGVLILWYQLPTGVNCRHVWLVGVTFLWSISTFITLISRTVATGKYHWRLTLIKDTCVAVPSLLVMFLSGVGMFNSCWCWSGPFQYSSIGRVPMPETVYLQNAKSVYLTIVGVTLLLEMVVFAVAATIWRRGFRLLRWSEETCREEWQRVMGNEGCKKCTHDGRSRQTSQVSETFPLKWAVGVTPISVDSIVMDQRLYRAHHLDDVGRD